MTRSSIHFTIVLLSLFCTVSVHCVRCPSGTFQAANNSCVICQAGTWRNARDTFLPRDAPCIPCRPGLFSPFPGAEGEDLCRPCGPNTFANTPGSTVCKPCRSGTSSNRRAEKCLVCGPGSRVAGNSKKCIPCRAGFYSSERTNRKCLPCPRYKTSSPGASSISQCKFCPPGESAFRGPCNKCPTGQAKLEPASECDACQAGTFSDVEGAVECKPCPPGTFQNRLFSTRCKPCRNGTTTLRFGNSVCRVIGEPCRKKFFEDRNGDCRSCQAGYRLNLVEKKCKKCPPGSVSPGGVQTICVPCIRGQIPDRSNRMCGCPRGKLPGRRGGCKPCPPGQSNSNVQPTGDSCFSCDPGTFSDRSGAIRCKRCPSGQIAPNSRSTKCTPCPEGTISQDTQCISKTTNCPLGFKRTFVGARNSFFRCRRVRCTLESDENEVGKTCVACDPGTFLDSEKKRCRRCRFDEFSLGGLVTECTKCPKGRVQDLYDPSKCACQGFRASGKGLQGGACLPCPPGSFSADDNEFCSLCPPGKFANKAGTEFCKECPIDTFSHNEGATRCTKCPQGTISDRRPGGIKCIPIPKKMKL